MSKKSKSMLLTGEKGKESENERTKSMLTGEKRKE